MGTEEGLCFDVGFYRFMVRLSNAATRLILAGLGETLERICKSIKITSVEICLRTVYSIFVKEKAYPNVDN